MSNLINEADRVVGIWTEELARKVDRRHILVKGIRGLAASVAAVSVGSFAEVKQVFAVTCTCNWIRKQVNCPSHCCCPTGAGCPSGCSFCTSSDSCGGWCIYPDGCWTSCNSFCTCGYGYKLCCDCKCNSCSGYLCTCLSQVICCQCCTPADVEAEMSRLQAEMGRLQAATTAAN